MGSKGEDVKQRQLFLQQMGLYKGDIDGIFGPATQKAVQTYQESQNIRPNGIIGPITSGKMNTHDARQQIQSNPNIQYLRQNDPEVNSVLTSMENNGDINYDILTNMVTNNLSPADANEFKNYYDEYYSAYDPYYKEQQTYDKGSIENQLGLNQRNQERYLADSAAQFGEDKSTLDKQSANQGILFSSARAQAEKGLQDKYTNDLASKTDAYQTNAKNQLLNYQNKWGGDVNSLSSYMQSPTQTYNASTPRNNVSSGGLSSFYNPGNYNLTGSAQNDRKYNAGLGAYTKLTANKR